MSMVDGLGPFQSEVTELYDYMVTSSAGAEDDRAIVTHPQYYDKGAECYAYRLRDRRHMLKVPLVGWMDCADREADPLSNDYMTESAMYLFDVRLEALDRAVGARRLEQMRAFTTFDTPGVVVDYIPSVPVRSMHERSYTTHDYHTLFDAFDDIENYNLATDPIGDNYLYVPDAGFHIIDFILPSARTTSRTQDVTKFGTKILEPVRHPQNARNYYQACREHYGQTMADALAESWHQEGIQAVS